MKKLLISLLVFFVTVSTSAADKKYVYTHVGQKEGLTSAVNCIYKEKDSDVWIGTPNGLYSFNGYALKSYGDMLQGSRRIFQIKRDRLGDLWVATDKGLLVRKNGSESFTKISEGEEPFFCMTFDDGSIWLGGRNKIFRYSYSDSSLKVFHTTPSVFDCRSIGFIDKNDILCCSLNGRLMINVKTGEITEDRFGPAKAVSASLIDKKGRVWIAYYNSGIEIYEKSGRKIRSYNTENSDLSNNIVLCLAERGSEVLAGTDGGGINIIDLEKDRIRILSHVSGDYSSFPAHSIKSLFTDHYGNVWAGSIRDGLININQSEISSYKDTHLENDNGLSDPTVLCIHQDKTSKHIWIGTDGEGINRFDPRSGKFTHFKTTFKTKVVSIADFSENELVVSTYADNIWKFNKTTGQMTPLNIANKDISYLIKYSGRSINVCNEADGDLLMFANTMYRYDEQTGHCKPITISGGGVSYSNLLIIGNSDDGIWMHNNTELFLLKDDADELISKGQHKGGEIRSGHLAGDGSIWLATEEGLCRFNTKNGSFSHIHSSIFSNATSVICDNRSRIWIGTEVGLSAYLSEAGSFAIFGESDGVEPNEYLPKPRLLADNGDIYFGGVQGLLHIGNGYTIEATETPVLKLEEVIIDGEQQEMNGTVLKAPRHSKTMDIGISVKEKDMFRHRLFRFSISGQVYETSLPQLSLPQMPNPGKHDIMMSCTRRNGEWTEPVKLMTLQVLQPWYLSWWFVCGCATIFVLIYIMTITTINKRKSNELKMAIKEQEQKVYEDKVRMLINISHELRTPLTLIMAPLKRQLQALRPGQENYTILSRIYRQSLRMRSLLDMVLDLRKMEVGGNRLKLESTLFHSWIRSSTDDIVSEEKADGIDIVYDFDPEIGSAEIDRQKCDIVLMNILINAIKHSSSGDTITIRTNLTADGMIRTSISDQGPGLGKDIDPDKMFTRFYQGNSEKYGSGIGLSYSKILVEMHGGHIGVFNNDDKGATFWWEIPVTVQENVEVEPRAYLNELLGHASEAEIATPANEIFNTSGMRLMLIDDNNDLLDFLNESLCEDFTEIMTFTGGRSALREINNGRLPDIIVSDVNMPDGDGFWLCSELKNNEKFSHIPFVLLTARGEDHSQSESYRLGADGFLAKPFEVDTLMELVRSLLKNKADIRKRYLDNNSEAEYGSNEERFILQLNKIIADNLSNPALDQQLICRELGVSRALLYNKMKAITGAGAKEYITKIRIEKAKSLIENSAFTIAEISDMTGFASQSYFSTAFKNYTGTTPSQYKQNNKKR